MKINPAGGPGFITENFKINKINAYKKAGELTRSGDEVSLSDEAVSFSKVFAEAKEAVGSHESDTASRIAELKEQIAAGTYRINSEDIAESILGDLYI